jgi:predicted nucleic acid-binding protein
VTPNRSQGSSQRPKSRSASRDVRRRVAVSQQFGLLSNDALLIALMQANGLTNLASNDVDFDDVAGITRYGPV